MLVTVEDYVSIICYGVRAILVMIFALMIVMIWDLNMWSCITGHEVRKTLKSEKNKVLFGLSCSSLLYFSSLYCITRM